MKKPRRESPSALTPEQWAEARALFEAGSTQREIAERFHVAHGTIGSRARAEGWEQDSEAVILRRTKERQSKIPIHADPLKKDEAINAEAQRRSEILDRHREDWKGLEALQRRAFGLNQLAIAGAFTDDGAMKKAEEATVDKARMAEAFDLARFVKISAETLQIRHGGERKAIGLDGAEDSPHTVRLVVERRAAVKRA